MKRYEHDCEKCIFLGCWEEYDLYFCSGVTRGSTVVARYGDDGHEYTSGLDLADITPPLAEARARAEKLELWKNEEGKL